IYRPAMSFEYPWMFAFVLGLPALWLYRRFRRRRRIALQYTYAPAPGPGGWLLSVLVPACYLLAWLLLVVALARPVRYVRTAQDTGRGLEVVIMLDISSSMLATDWKPNRLAVARHAISQFVQQRPQDRIGLGLFAQRALSFVPITQDHPYLLAQLAEVHVGMIPPAGSNLGDAIGLGIQRLSQATASDRILILVTDAQNNTGMMDPEAVARYARAHQVAVQGIYLGDTADAQSARNYLRQICSHTAGRIYTPGYPQDMAASLRHLDQYLQANRMPRYVQQAVLLHRPILWLALGLCLLAAVLQFVGLANPIEQ
ncbi:MAG: VWA domain-containing protein, partial [Sphingobacteriia bacterium]